MNAGFQHAEHGWNNISSFYVIILFAVLNSVLHSFKAHTLLLTHLPSPEIKVSLTITHVNSYEK